MKCKEYVDKNVRVFEGTPEEMREYFQASVAKVTQKTTAEPKPSSPKAQTKEEWKAKISESLKAYHAKRKRAGEKLHRKSRKASNNSTIWTAEEDAKVREFCNTPGNYFKKNGYVQQTKLVRLARDLNRSVLAVRARMGTLNVGSHKQVKAMIAKANNENFKKIVETDEKIAEKKKEERKEEKKTTFPNLMTVHVPRDSYMATFKYFTSKKGNVITQKDAFPLFGIEQPHQWDNFLQEAMNRADIIARALEVENAFKMEATTEGKVLKYG